MNMPLLPCQKGWPHHLVMLNQQKRSSVIDCCAIIQLYYILLLLVTQQVMESRVRFRFLRRARPPHPQGGGKLPPLLTTQHAPGCARRGGSGWGHGWGYLPPGRDAVWGTLSPGQRLCAAASALVYISLCNKMKR